MRGLAAVATPPVGPARVAGRGDAAGLRACGDRDRGEPLSGQHHRQQVGALHQRAGRRRRDDGAVVRRNAPQRTELSGAVRRQHLRANKDTCPVDVGAPPNLAPNCSPPATRSLVIPKTCPRSVRRPAARANTPASTCPGSTSATSRPRSRCRSPRSRRDYQCEPADGVVRDPQQRQQHARRLVAQGDAWLNEPDVGVRQLGKGQQQPADRHLGRGRRRAIRSRRCSTARMCSPAATTKRSATTTCSPRWSRCTGYPKRVTRRMPRPSQVFGAAKRRRAGSLSCAAWLLTSSHPPEPDRR